MKLGGSLRRSRGRKKNGSSKKKPASGEASSAKPGIFALLRWVAILAVLGFGGGYLFSTRILFPAPPPPGNVTQMPDLSGESLADASARVEAEGMTVGVVDSLRHPSVPAGNILGQSPLAGQLGLVGGEVRLALSLGPEERPVPDVMRLRADRAQTVLEATGFQVVVDSIESEIPRGSVVAMNPEAGTEATVPQEIILTVSMGPPMVEMPLLLGLQEVQALAIVDSLGLAISAVDTRFRFGRDQGLVVEQEPPATTLVERGTAVRLVVGRRGG